MSTEETKALIAQAKRDVEAAKQLKFWARELEQAHEARRVLLDMKPQDVVNALEQRHS